MKLRQKTKKMSGFSLALHLVVYEAIPQLLARLGGTDELKFVYCEKLPQQIGLNLVDVLEGGSNHEVCIFAVSMFLGVLFNVGECVYADMIGVRLLVESKHAWLRVRFSGGVRNYTYV